VFGYSEERRHERADIAAYEAEVEQLCAIASPGNIGTVLAIARLPQDVRGFGPVKAAARDKVLAERARLWGQLRASPAQVAA
jgi:indolepyruvate ferredoxin oxidoreductase